MNKYFLTDSKIPAIKNSFARWWVESEVFINTFTYDIKEAKCFSSIEELINFVNLKKDCHLNLKVALFSNDIFIKLLKDKDIWPSKIPSTYP